jgi:hypothetical protein
MTSQKMMLERIDGLGLLFTVSAGIMDGRMLVIR